MVEVVLFHSDLLPVPMVGVVDSYLQCLPANYSGYVRKAPRVLSRVIYSVGKSSCGQGTETLGRPV